MPESGAEALIVTHIPGGDFKIEKTRRILGAGIDAYAD